MAQILNFAVHVGEPEIVRPETATPHEIKYLCNFDHQTDLRNHLPFVHFYPLNKPFPAQDPVLMIKQALAKVLVYYYPVAGRLRDTDNGKLAVDCCGEGVVFRGANAGITMAQLQRVEGGLRPPFPMWDRLLVDDIWGSHRITDSPLLHMQVTRLACGGFALAYTFNHCICDAYGAYLFMTALSEFCINPNCKAPSVIPSWGREILKSRTPPLVSYPHPEYDVSHHPKMVHSETDFKDLAQTSIFFSNSDISALKNQVNGNKTSTFHVVASCLWRARTRTLMKPCDITRLVIPIDTRFQYQPSLPKGYYGSALVFPCAIAKSDELVGKPLSYAVSLIAAAKRRAAGDEYRASVLDLIEVNGSGGLRREGAYVITDVSRLRFGNINLGYGPGVYGGVARAGTGPAPGLLTPIVWHKNEEGVEGVLALASLPQESVDCFHMEVRKQIHSPTKLKPVSAL